MAKWPAWLDAMKRYQIERNIPKVGGLSREQYRGLAATFNAALARLAGFPVTRVTEVPTEICLMTVCSD